VDGEIKENFWLGKRLPSNIEVADGASLPAILVKKQETSLLLAKDNSFLSVMEELYQRVKTKNREVM